MNYEEWIIYKLKRKQPPTAQINVRFPVPPKQKPTVKSKPKHNQLSRPPWIWVFQIFYKFSNQLIVHHHLNVTLGFPVFRKPISKPIKCYPLIKKSIKNPISFS